VDVPDQFSTSEYLAQARESHSVVAYLPPPLPNTGVAVIA